MEKKNISKYIKNTRNFLDEFQVHLERFYNRHPEVNIRDKFLEVIEKTLYYEYALIERSIQQLKHDKRKDVDEQKLINYLAGAVSYFNKMHNQLLDVCEKDLVEWHIEATNQLYKYFYNFFKKSEELLNIHFISPNLGDKYDETKMTTLKTYILEKEKREKFSDSEQGVLMCGKVGIEEKDSGKVLVKAEVAKFEEEPKK